MADKKRILVIDDEADFGWFLKLNLEGSGLYEVRCEKNGEAGIAAVAGFKPDLILLDIAMPGLDGYQTSEQLRKNPSSKNINILFLTGKELLPSKIAERCQGFGRCDFINKPFMLDVLLKKIQEFTT
ncbi:MAG: response regulator [Deltaproteobacteria bacterium]